MRGREQHEPHVGEPLAEPTPETSFEDSFAAAIAAGADEADRAARRREERYRAEAEPVQQPTGEPSPYCDRHPNGTDGLCRGCGQARRARDAWHETQRRAEAQRVSSEARARAELRAAAIAACPMCDDDGYEGPALCHHDPDRPTKPGRGAAALHAAMEAKRAARDHLTGPHSAVKLGSSPSRAAHPDRPGASNTARARGAA